MERTRSNKADLILTGDWHLREDNPECRKDNLWGAQWSKVQEIKELQEFHQCPILHSGDLFDHWKPSPCLLSRMIEEIPNQFYTIFGNHDLPQHNLDLVNKTGINTLFVAGKLKILPGCHWEETPQNSSFNIKNKKILVWHIMTYQGKKPWYNIEAPQGITLLKKYPKYDLVLTGHNHLSFTEKYKGRCIVNPGSITRQTSSQIDYIPKVYLWYASTNEAKPYILNYNKTAIRIPPNTEHTKERDERIDAFISKLNTDWESSISFEDNIKRFLERNDIPTSTKDIIEKAIDYE